MFFTILCLLLWALFAFKSPFDQFGWLMIVGFAWVCGYLDCRFFSKTDQDKDRVMPPGDDRGEDASIFNS
jgi:hypothetical protein